MKTSIFAQLISDESLPKVGANGTSMQTVLNIVFIVIGALGFLMLVIAGFRYIMYGSDAAKLSEVKRQIAHVLLGLLVVALAASIVNFVINRINW